MAIVIRAVIPRTRGRARRRAPRGRLTDAFFARPLVSHDELPCDRKRVEHDRPRAIAVLERRSDTEPEVFLTLTARAYRPDFFPVHVVLLRKVESLRKAPQRARAAAEETGAIAEEAANRLRERYERLLAGSNGERRVIVDSHGREVAEEARPAPRACE